MNADYAANGYLVVRDFIQKSEAAALMVAAHDIFAAKLDALKLPYRRDNGLLESDVLFDLFAHHRQAYIGCMKAVQGLPHIFQLGNSANTNWPAALRDAGIKVPAFSTKPIIMFHHERVATSEAYWKIPPHQDWRSIQGSLNCVVLWIALVDVPAKMGPVQVVPKSHLGGLLPAEADDWYMHVLGKEFKDADFVSTSMNAGDAMLFSAFLLHRSGHNQSADLRCSLQFRFNDLADKTFIDRDYPDPYLYRPTKELITPAFPTKADVRKVFGVESRET